MFLETRLNYSLLFVNRSQPTQPLFSLAVITRFRQRPLNYSSGDLQCECCKGLDQGGSGHSKRSLSLSSRVLDQLIFLFAMLIDNEPTAARASGHTVVV